MREKIAPNDIHRRLLNVYGDQTVDVSTVRRWVERFSSGDSDVPDGHAQLSYHEMKSVSISSSYNSFFIERSFRRYAIKATDSVIQ